MFKQLARLLANELKQELLKLLAEEVAALEAQQQAPPLASGETHVAGQE